MKLALVPVLFLLLAISLGVNLSFLSSSYNGSIVTAVPDGDSFQLKDGRRIRLLGVDAPERGRCGADEARIRLESLIKGEHASLTDLVTDDYGRQLASVTVRGIFVNEVLIREGLVKYTSVNNSHASAMKDASTNAEKEKLGIHSPTCRPSTSPTGCSIKGNMKNGNKTYHLPRCKNYDQTIIDLSYGDQWFCTEEEAMKEGFVKAAGCK